MKNLHLKKLFCIAIFASSCSIFGMDKKTEEAWNNVEQLWNKFFEKEYTKCTNTVKVMEIIKESDNGYNNDNAERILHLQQNHCAAINNIHKKFKNEKTLKNFKNQIEAFINEKERYNLNLEYLNPENKSFDI